MPAASALPACPCGRTDSRRRALPYAQCCGRYIDHFAQCPAPDAESLMRSRYTAFVREDAAYLRATWQAAHRPAQLGFEPGVRWLGLQVRAHLPVDVTHAEVEFVARQRDALPVVAMAGGERGQEQVRQHRLRLGQVHPGTEVERHPGPGSHRRQVREQ